MTEPVSHVGRLLVATPVIGDPNFERTVILLLAHGEEGAFGVVLNRPSDTDVAEIVVAWAPLVVLPDVMFLGGPVGRNAVIGLGRLESQANPDQPDGQGGVEGPPALIPGVTSVDLNDTPFGTGGDLAGVRLFAGSAGWAGGQLDDELAEGAWWLVDVVIDDIFTADPSGLWSRVLRRQPGSLAWFANHPSEASVN